MPAITRLLALALILISGEALATETLNWKCQAKCVDAVVNWDNGKVYFFKDNQYWRYDVKANRIDDGFPKVVNRQSWRNWPESWDKIDAAVNWGNGKAYFFRGKEYLRYDITSDSVDADFPQPIDSRHWSNWPEDWRGGINAVVALNDGKAYFFKGNQFLRYDLARDRVDDGYPQPIAGHWPGFPKLWTTGIDAAVNWNDGKAWFFRKNQYVRYDIERQIVDDYRGLGASPLMKKRHVLLIGIDGMRPDALLAAKPPNLSALIANGMFSDKAQAGDITNSGPGWSTVLTGTWRNKHLVTSNDFLKTNFERYPDLFALLKRKKSDAEAYSITTWQQVPRHIVSGADVEIGFDCCVEKTAPTWPRLANGNPAQVGGIGDIFVTRAADESATAAAVNVLRYLNPDIVYVLFEQVDMAGHVYGFSSRSAHYLTQIENVDVLVGRLLAAIKSRPSYAREEWLILSVTDHGGTGKGHGANIPEHRTIYFLASGPGTLKGNGCTGEPCAAPEQVDITPTALTYLGVKIDPAWGLDGKAAGLKP